MKTILKFSVLLLAIGLVLGLASCEDDNENEKGTKEPIVSFESFSSPSIIVNNMSDTRLVAFKGALNPNNLISGIPAYADNHGLAKSDALFSSTGDFLLILITEDQYNQNKTNLGAAKVFTEIYAFYNHEMTNNTRYQISSLLGGSGRIILNNSTNWNIEIHKDGTAGEVIGYAAPQASNKILWVKAPYDYILYPVFKRYFPSAGEIYTIIPMYTSGPLTGKTYSKNFTLSTADSTANWDLAEAANFTLTLGCFYLRIVNNSNTAVRFFRGEEVQLTSMGISTINSGSTYVYAVRITRNPDGTYPASQEISGLKIGIPQNLVSVPTNTYKPDYVYTITVTGANATNLVLGEIQESENPIDIDEMFRY